MATIAIPNTGTTTSMGKIGHALNNVASGSQPVSIGNTAPTARLNVNATAFGKAARSATQSTVLTSVFGGGHGPFNYS